jgi:hypothetical protein
MGKVMVVEMMPDTAPQARLAKIPNSSTPSDFWW